MGGVTAQTNGAAIRSGLDLSHVDAQARPQDDLFGHVNGRWLTDYEIPADRATDGAFRSLFDRAEEQVRDLITEAAAEASRADAGGATDQQRIGDLYASFMDEDAVAAPRRATTARRAGADRRRRRRRRAGRGARRAAAHRSRRRRRASTSTPTRRTRPATCCTSTSPGSGCPTSRTTATRSTPRSWPPTPATSRGCSRSSTAAHAEEHAHTAARIVALETKLAAAHWDVVKRRDADLTYNLRAFADLAAEAPGFDWTGWITALGSSPDAGRRTRGAPARLPDRVRGAVVVARTSTTGSAGPRWRLIHARAAHAHR